MIKSYMSRTASREEVIKKAWELIGLGQQVLSIEHTMARWDEQESDGWARQGFYPSYVITVDTEGTLNWRLPEIKENLSNAN